jgi:flagellar basal-body rod protein FlgB
MTGVYLFDIASKQASYLAVRQATIAGNVANANTPDYKARDVMPFAQVLARTGMDLATTSAAHSGSGGLPVRAETASGGWEVMETASGVSLEQEMLKASEVSREHNLNTSIVKSFHRMLTLAVRSGS